jgi:putative ABC transport system permease protein
MAIGPILRAMRHNRVRVALIVIEIALTLAIVTNCVNMILNARQTMTRKSGFDDANLVQISLDNFGKDFEDAGYLRNTIDADVRAIRGIPGVVNATNTYFLPWIGGGSSGYVFKPGDHEPYQTQLYPAGQTMFDTLGVKITEGRGFTAADYEPVEANQPSRAYVISRALAKKIFGNVSPVGKIVTSRDGSSPRHIVGVIDDFYNPYGWPIGEFVLFGSRRSGDNNGASYLVRVAPGSMKSVTGVLEQRVLANNHNRVATIRNVSEVKDRFFQTGRLTIVAMSAVIVILVFVTALGIVGMTSLSVTERTRQIGTRRALGATRRDILTQFLTENWLITTGGLLLGIGAAYGLNFALAAQVAGAKLDWWLLAAGMILLWVAGLAATLPPALRASGLSPAIATRSV